MQPSFPETQHSTPADSAEKRNLSWLKAVGEIFQTLLLAFVLYFAIDAVVARVRVENISMQPTLKPGEFVLVHKLAYRFGEIQRGDIVVFHYSPQEDYIKRVIGLPGDMVEIADGLVKVNGYPLKEPYINSPPMYNGTWEVPEGKVFVLGDNRNQSSDSHTWGFVPIENIVGKAFVVYWPLEEVKILTTQLTVIAKNQP
ncbi:MAG: signal peptidase I [Chloroflexota bacterium]